MSAYAGIRFWVRATGSFRFRSLQPTITDYAFLIARARSNLHFLHGLLVGVVNSAWVTSARDSPRLMMALVGPVIGVLSGLVPGLLASSLAKQLSPG